MRYGLAGLARGLHGVAAGTANQCCIVGDRQWLAEEISLHSVATFVGQECKLLLSFNAFGDDRHLEPVAETNDGANDRGRLRVTADVDHEGAVDLDLVERKSLQITQGRITAAEIVHRYPYPECLQPPQQCQA